TELRCSVALDSKSGRPTAGRKVKGTIHWVSAARAIDAEVRLYDRLFTVPEPDSAAESSTDILSVGAAGVSPGESTRQDARSPHRLEACAPKPRDFKSFINANSLDVANAKCEPALANARPEERYQFERLGYFALDPDSTPQKQIWNRTATLRDTWAKEARK